jgi:putative SOS response-associated peptidase YedK
VAPGVCLRLGFSYERLPVDQWAEVHDRIPVPLTEKQLEPWLSGEACIEYLKPADNDTVADVAGLKADEQFEGAGR